MTAAKKVLIIDDEIDLTQMVAFQFKSLGYEAQTAPDGVAGLEAAERFRPDLIILDINMPRMGGIEFYSKICGPNGKPLYPVMVLTARANIQGLFQDLQIDGFMIKPFEIDQLVNEAAMIIKKRSEEATGLRAGLFRKPGKICIVDHDRKVAVGLSGLFIENDFTVIPAASGALGLEKMMKDVPDAAAVHLGLSDIPGDILIYRLSQMAKTRDVKFVLYTHRTAEHDAQVMERIRSKTGIYTFVEYSAFGEILLAVNKAFSV